MTEGAPTTCPKCRNIQDDPRACHRCGLDFERFARGSATLPASADETHPVRGAVEARWAELREQLDDEDAHGAFINLCAQHGLLAFAGRSYRELTPAGAEEDPRVAEYRRRVLMAAMAQLPRPRRDEEKGRQRALLILTFGAALFLAVCVGWYIYTRMQTMRLASH